MLDGEKPDSKNLFWLRDVDTSHVRRFSVDFLLAVVIWSFVARHIRHVFAQLVYGGALPLMSYVIVHRICFSASGSDRTILDNSEQSPYASRRYDENFLA